MNPFEKKFTVCFIRHGAVAPTFNKRSEEVVYTPHAPLSETGHRQILDLAHELQRRKVTFDALFASPYARALQSAQILTSELHVPLLYPVDYLHDVFPNSAEGKTFEDVARIHGDIYSHPMGPEQESLDHLLQRSHRAFEMIAGFCFEKKYESVGILSHGDVLSSIVWSLTHEGVPNSYEEMTKEFYLEKGEAYRTPVDEFLRIFGEGEKISVDEVKRTAEHFRLVSKEKK